MCSAVCWLSSGIQTVYASFSLRQLSVEMFEHGLFINVYTVGSNCAATGPGRDRKWPRAGGRNRGRLTTKRHAVADTRGRPRRLGLSASQRHDVQ
jgi:hypothetical protein